MVDARGKGSGMGSFQNDSKLTDANEKKEIVKNNNIRPIRFRKQLVKVNLDLDSPRMREAMTISGVESSDLEIK